LSTSAISKRYAKALVSLGSEQSKVNEFGQQLADLSHVFESEDLLRLLLESPSLSPEKKTGILDEIMDKLETSDTMRDFFGLLMLKGRMVCIGQINQKYRELADELSGILRARVTAAGELGAKDKKAIGAELEKQTGKKVELTVDVDASLIGGLRTEIGGRLFDGSIKTQLKRIENTLTKG
jgi:F-type H+-transporting ATPase subunit delta